MAFEDYSEIEDFRITCHGDDQLRLLRRHSGSKKYEVIAILDNGFLIGRDYSTAESQLQEVLTIDLRYQATLSADDLETVIAVDLVKRADETKFKRYSTGSNSPPCFSENIYFQTVNANFADRNSIVDPEP